MRFSWQGLTVLAAWVGITLAQASDPRDYVLSTYRITADQEASLAFTDKVSPYWNAWDSLNATGTVLDYAEQTVEGNGYSAGAAVFTGHDDCYLQARSAYSDKGLYLYFQIKDNGWMPPAGDACDRIQVFLDKITSDDIMTGNPYDLYVQPSWGWTITYYSLQLAVSVGGSTAPQTVGIDYFSGSAMAFNEVNVSQLETDYSGMKFSQSIDDATTRVQEWFIPWQWVGSGGGLGSTPAPDTRFAFFFGYNDQDPGDPTDVVKRLRWRERDPYKTCNDLPTPHTFCNAWGDIVINAQPTPVVNKRTVATGHTSAPRALHADYFSLTGRKIASRSSGPVIRRTVSANGTAITAKTCNIR